MGAPKNFGRARRLYRWVNLPKLSAPDETVGAVSELFLII